MEPKNCSRCKCPQDSERVGTLEGGIRVSVLPRSNLCLHCTVKKAQDILRYECPEFFKDGKVQWEAIGDRGFRSPAQRKKICFLLQMTGFLSEEMRNNWIVWKDGLSVTSFVDERCSIFCFTDKGTAESFARWVDMQDGYGRHWMEVREATTGRPASRLVVAAA